MGEKIKQATVDCPHCKKKVIIYQHYKLGQPFGMSLEKEEKIILKARKKGRVINLEISEETQMELRQAKDKVCGECPLKNECDGQCKIKV